VELVEGDFSTRHNAHKGVYALYVFRENTIGNRTNRISEHGAGDEKREKINLCEPSQSQTQNGAWGAMYGFVFLTGIKVQWFFGYSDIWTSV